jgi:ABC-type transport system substrate-binding protein
VVYKINPQGTVVANYTTGEGAKEVSYSDGVLWVGNQDAGTVSGIDAVTGNQTTYRFEHPLGAIAAGSGSLLVQMGPGRTYEDRIDALQGKVARFLVQAYQLSDPDPATSWTNPAFEVEFATCAKLLNYPDKPSPDGWTLQPEVAASMPDVSADGRTYTFTVRPGYRFSPPSNQPVTAETFRYSIERALSPALSPGYWGPGVTPGSIYVGDIQGETAFRTGKAEHISGLRVSGDRLTITLTRSSPDLLERLAMPFFCPVPTGTPAVPAGAVLHTEGSNGPDDTVPSAGPYYIAGAVNGEYVILKRNPNYMGPRPHTLDAIALREGIDPGQAVGRVEGGTWDGTTNLGDSVMSPDGQVAKAWGPNGTSASTSSQRYYPVPDGGLWLLELNANRPLLTDRLTRQAIGYALDRPAIARIIGGVSPTDQPLPPNQSAFRDGGLFGIAPDLRKARSLMHGTRGTLVLISYPDSLFQQMAQEIRSDLSRIGISVRIKLEDDAAVAFSEPGAPYDLKVGALFTVAPLDSIAYLSKMLTEVLPRDRESPAVRAVAAQVRTIPNRAGALALLQRTFQVEAPIMGIAYTAGGAFFAPRLGCRVFPPASYGVDFAALCLTGT